MKTIILKYFPWEAPGEKKGSNSGGRTVDNAIKTFSCIQEPGECCPQQDQKGFWVLSLEIYSRRLHRRADGATQKVMAVARDLGTTDKDLAAGQSASVRHTCSENSYHVPPLAQLSGEGRKGEGEIHIDEIGSS